MNIKLIISTRDISGTYSVLGRRNGIQWGGISMGYDDGEKGRSAAS
jgi:hypothetical protein